MGSPPDVVFLSSVFGSVKLAEPMGVGILTAALREAGRTVAVVEPSVHGWSVEQAVAAVATHGSPIIALSMLRDRNIADVSAFVRLMRAARPDCFLVMGGHGITLSLSGLRSGLDIDEYVNGGSDQNPVSQPVDGVSQVRTGRGTTPSPSDADVACGTSLPLIPIEVLTSRLVVDPSLSDRGKGPGFTDGESEAPVGSTYYDISRDYLTLLGDVDAFMLGESDTNFPELVGSVLAGSDWRSIAGVVYRSDGLLVKRPLPPKVASLDSLPLMARDVLVEYQKIYPSVPASLLGSRGCFYRCTFCSVVKYERLQEGSSHRVRGNKAIVDEIRHLHDAYGTTSFNFEDDNFIVKNKAGVARLHELCDMLIQLPFKVSFTFFCRADVVQPNLFAHLAAAGLSGIYFGLESVHEADLEFFHKGLSVSQMFDALDTLESLGFSPRVDAAKRVLLGYITWHPLTSFASLTATGAFVRQYGAPPKLLRRKLRLYAGTEVLTDVMQMGLLDPQDKDGWRFRDPALNGLDDRVNDLFALVNKRRDMVRTVEKSIVHRQLSLDASTYARHRVALDSLLYDSFDEIISTAREVAAGSRDVRLQDCLERSAASFAAYVDEHDVMGLVAEGYAAAGLATTMIDPYRK